MKKWCYIGLMVAICLKLNGQNLIINGGFEDTLACPYAPNQFHYAFNYFGINTCDYFNRCSSTPYLVPETNFVSPLSPASGDAMVGIGFSKDPNDFYREVIWTKLPNKLKNIRFIASVLK
jgi:hypothetical protein